MNVLLSIKPMYVKEILAGRKRYEFRKSIYKNKNIKNIYIYSSAPEQKIVAKFVPSKIVEDSPDNLWSKYKRYAGISQDEFFNYFENKSNGFAITIDSLHIFRKPINPREVIEEFIPPQSFKYIDKI